MKRTIAKAAASAASLMLCSGIALAQSGATRPRRVTPVQPTTTDAAVNTSAGNNAASTTPTTSTRAVARSSASGAGAEGTTEHAYTLYKQKQYDAALREARQLTASDPKNPDAWKIAGFAERSLKQYPEATADLERALDLQKAAGAPDASTEDALADSYFFSEKYEQALPLFVIATERKDPKPDARTFLYRGLTEMNLKKTADAERSFNDALKLDPKNTGALVYLGQLAFTRSDYTTAVNMLNRATLADPTSPQAWELLTQAYMYRGRGASGAQADSDFLAAVRASDSLARLRNDARTATLQGQALIFAKQYVRAATALERATAAPQASADIFYLLGFAEVQNKNFPKAIAALEQAASKTPENVDVYRLLGFSYESSKQYAKALAAYEKGQQLAPADTYFKESADRVRPFAK